MAVVVSAGAGDAHWRRHALTGVTVGTFYDDNVFATNTNRQSDWAFFARPESMGQARAKLHLHDRRLDRGPGLRRFSSEDQINGGAGAGFTVMPDNDTQVVAGARYIHEHLDRGASETVVAIPGMGYGIAEHVIQPSGRL